MTSIVTSITGSFNSLGRLTLFIDEILRTLRKTRGNLQPILEQILNVTYRSFSTVAFSGIFIGAILVLQFNSILAKYDAQVFLGGLNTSSIIREVGPLIISFLLAGKVGAFTTAELGTMRVTEQIDAIRCLGTNPLQFLVLPRFIAIAISSVILLTLALLISILGSIGFSYAFCGINPLQFIQTIPRFVNHWILFASVVKCLVYGTIVAAVSCYEGYFATGGAQGVGQAVTRAAVRTNLYIIFSQFVMSQLFNSIGEWLKS